MKAGRKSNLEIGVWLIVLLNIQFTACAQVGDVDAVNQKNEHTYFGYTVSAAFQHYKLTSDIAALNKMKVSREGGSVGVMAGNSKGVLKSSVGLYYAAPSEPYSIDVIEAGISGSVYLLRLKQNKCHALEPYATVAVEGVRSTFFGNYLGAEKNRNRTGKEEFLGRVVALQTLAGIGAEYRLANDAMDFIHFFAEVSYGYSMFHQASNASFEGTSTRQPVTVEFGISFGKIR